MASLVVSNGYAVATGRLIGATPTQAEPKNLSWGTGSGTTAISDVALFTQAPEARVVGTSSQVTTTTSNDTYQVVGTVVAGETEAITNVGLFDVSTSAPQTQLTAPVTSNAQASITVASASGFPNSGNYFIQVFTEVMEVTGGQGSTTWTVSRGANGSTPLTSISNNTYVTGGQVLVASTVATTGGNLFAKSDFTALPLNSGDSITFTYQVVAS